MNRSEELIFLLKAHGFHIAAEFMNIREVKNINEAIDEWKKYPKCLDSYPKRIKKKPHFSS